MNENFANVTQKLRFFSPPIQMGPSTQVAHLMNTTRTRTMGIGPSLVFGLNGPFVLNGCKSSRG